MKKADLRLHCNCGCMNFLMVRGMKEDKYALVCEACGDTVAIAHGYGIDWVGDDDDVDTTN